MPTAAAIVITPDRITADAVRFPDLARTYYRRGPDRVLGALAEQFARLDALGVLTVADPGRAADDFTFLLVGRVLDRGMFHPPTTSADPVPSSDPDAVARHAVAVFLVAYRAASPPAPGS